MLVDDIIAAIETARDRVMAEEVKSMIKLGLPRRMAEQTVAGRFHVKLEDEDGSGGADFDSGQWQDLG